MHLHADIDLQQSLWRDRDRCALDASTHAFGDGRPECRRTIRQDDREFLTADARHSVHRPHRVEQGFRNAFEHQVAGRVAVLIVDVLEVIDIDHQHQRRFSRARRDRLRGSMRFRSSDGSRGRSKRRGSKHRTAHRSEPAAIWSSSTSARATNDRIARATAAPRPVATGERRRVQSGQRVHNIQAVRPSVLRLELRGRSRWRLIRAQFRCCLAGATFTLRPSRSVAG